MKEIIGQILSIVAVIMGFVSFQMKTPRGVLILQLITALLFFVHYLLIDAISAAGLNFISSIQCICYYFRDKRKKKSFVITIFFSIIIIITSILTWSGWYTMFIMTGLVVLNIGFAFSVRTIRKMNLIKSPLCLLYNVCVLSIGGIAYEMATFISSIIAIIKAQIQKKTEKTVNGAKSNEKI